MAHRRAAQGRGHAVRPADRGGVHRRAGRTRSGRCRSRRRARRPRDRDGPGPRRSDRAAAHSGDPCDRQHDGRAPAAGPDGVLAGAGLRAPAADGGGRDACDRRVRRAVATRPRDAIDWTAALAFGGFIAFGELLRLALPGGREAAPIAMVGAMAYALLLALPEPGSASPQWHLPRSLRCWSSPSPRSA